MQVLLGVLLPILLTTVQGGIQFIEEPEDKFVVLRSTVRWTCTASTTVPGATISYSWRFQEVGLIQDDLHRAFTDGSLVLPSVMASDMGTYQCLASDGVSQKFSRKASLQQSYLAPSFHLSPTNQIARTADTITLSCAINSVPEANITWQHEGQPIRREQGIRVNRMTSQGSQLTLENITFSDAGYYRCRATNDKVGDVRFIRYSGSARLELEGKPRFLVEPSPVILAVGQVARLRCAAGGYPEPDVTWYDSRDPTTEVIIQGSSKYSLANDTLTIRDVTMADAGFYTCRADNGLGQRSKTVLVSVTEGSTRPTFIRVPENTTVFAGETVTWTCSASGRPTPIISWARVGAVIAEQRMRTPYPGTMQLLDVGQRDAGVYLCRAAGDNDVTISHNWTLTVQERPLIELSPEDKAVVDGHPVVLNCRATGRPVPVLTWTLPDSVVVPVPGSSRLHEVVTYGNGSLVIQSVQRQHAGRYTCTARNVVGAQSAAAVLYVYYGPQFTTTPTTTTVMEGSPAFLHCAGAGYPQPTVTWYGPASNQTLQNGRGIRVLANGTLVLENVYRWQEGGYTCVLQNSVNQMAVSAELHIMVPPSFTSSALDIVVREGATVSMPCSAEGRPRPNIRWQLFNEETLALQENMVLHPNGTLTIYAMTPRQYGAYVCIALSDAGMRAQTSYLRPDDVPVFTVTPQNGTGNVSSTAHFKCAATARAPPTVHWYRWVGPGTRGTPLSADNMDGRGYVTHDADLVFEELLESDEGWYICIAENSYGNATAGAYLDVKVPPRITSRRSPIVIDEGSDVTLQCPVTSDPPPMWSWQPPRSDIILTESSGDYVIDGDKVNIMTAEVGRDAGTWRCKACNYLGCSHGDVTLQVNGGAVLVGANASHDPITNITRMRCVAAGTPTPTIIYEWEGLPIVGGASAEKAGLRLTHDGWVEAIGEVRPPYGCTASNRLGTDTGTIAVPSMPSDIRISDITNTSMAVTWQQSVTSLLLPSHIVFYLTTPEVAGRSPQTLLVPVISTDTSNGDKSKRQKRDVTPNMADDGISMMRTPVGGSTSLAYTLDDLQPYTRYRIQMATRNLLGQSEYSVPTDITMESGAPSAPTDLRADFTEGKLVVFWNRPLTTNGNPDALEYLVEYHTSAPGGSSLTSRVPAGRPLVATFSGTKRGETVDVRVSAINTDRNLQGPAATIVLVINGHAPTTPPAGVRARPVGDTDIHVEWQESPTESGIVGYVVAVGKEAASDFTVFRLSSAQARTYRVTGVDPGTGYYIKVAAYNYGGVGPYSTLVPISMPTTGGALRPATESGGGLGQQAVIGIVAGCVAGIFLVLLALLACCHYHRHRRQLLEKDIDIIYQQNQSAFYDNEANEEYLTDTFGSRKSVMADFYGTRNQHGDSRTSTLSRITTQTMDSNLPGPPDVLPTHRSPAEGTSLPDVHQRLGAADYELAEVTYGHSPAISQYSTGSSGTGTYAELDLPPNEAVNPLYAGPYPQQSRPVSLRGTDPRAPSGQRRKQPSSDVIVLSVADVWSLAPSSTHSRSASAYNTEERTTHFTNQTFRPLPATLGHDPQSSATLGRDPRSTSSLGRDPRSTSTLGRDPRSTSTLGRDPRTTSTLGRDPRNPAPRRNNQPQEYQTLNRKNYHREFETVTRHLDFDSESSDGTVGGSRGRGGVGVGSKRGVSASSVRGGSTSSAAQVESGFSPDITFWQTPVTDHSAGLF